MYERLLFPTDGSDGAAVALEHAIGLAAAHGATLHVLNVADSTRDSVTRIGGDVVDALEREGKTVVDETAETARDRGVDVVTAVLQGEPALTIVDYADVNDVDLVVMPTRGRRGLERLLLGSTTERVVRQATTPVLTIRPDDDVSVRYPYRNVLVPTDGSDGARAALDHGIDLAAADETTLHLLSVVDMTSLGVDVRADLQTEMLRETAEAVVDDAEAVATAAGVESLESAVSVGTSISGGIRDYVADHDVDLVVVGTHGRTGLDRYLLGSVTAKLVRTSPVPVLTVRSAPSDE